jgi:hypothetical protein
MAGVPSVIILPPVAPGPERAAPGASGATASPRVSAVERIAPPREEARSRQPRPNAGEGERSRRREGRELRHLAVRSGAGQAPQPFGAVRFAASRFLVQVLGQGSGPPAGPLAQHRDGAALGSEAYRRAGAEPAHYSEQPTLFRIAV